MNRFQLMTQPIWEDGYETFLEDFDPGLNAC